MPPTALCAAASNLTADTSRLSCSAIYYHAAPIAPMLVAAPQRRRGRGKRCGDGCFTSARCHWPKCNACPYPQSCRNRTRTELASDQVAIAQNLQPKVWQSASVGTCAVVGSSAHLLGARDGGAIDAHDLVIRVNTAPVRGFEAYVGRRTDVRVWGATAPPRQLDEIADVVPRDPTRVNPMRFYKGLIGSETVLRYCGPNPWLSSCWKNISRDTHADPRFHPAAWRLASALIYTNRTRCRRVGCVPSTGAMAVLFALERCRRTRIYGFGVAGVGGVPADDADGRACVARQSGAPAPATPLPPSSVAGADDRGAASRAAAGQRDAERLCWKSRHCEKYYECGRSVYYYDALAMPRRRAARALATWGSVVSGGYWSVTARYHDVGQEWGWLARLHASGLVEWRGAPDRRAPSIDPCYRRRAECWLGANGEGRTYFDDD